MKRAYSLILSAIAVVITFLGPVVTQAEQKLVPETITDMRDMRFCEFLLIYKDRVEIYNTSASAGCDPKIWNSLNVDDLAKDHGAVKAQLNGPKYWAADSQTLGLGIAKDFGGIEARYGATLPLEALGSGEGSAPYAPYVTNKEQVLMYSKGKSVYELVDKDGNAFVLNAYGAKVKDNDPANLAHQLSLPDGWFFRVRVLEEDLVKIHSGDTPSTMVGDDLHHYYSQEDNK